MKKVINKKIISILMAVIFIACTAIIPVSAEETVFDSTFEGFSIEYLGESDDLDARAVEYVYGIELRVYPSMYKDGQYYYNDDWYAITSGKGTTPYNCYIPSSWEADLTASGCNRFIIKLTFQVVGTNISRYELESNGSVIAGGSLTQAGTYTLQWIVPKEYTTYGLTIYAANLTSNFLGGHISIE